MNLSPPSFIKKFDYRGCVQVNDPITKKRTYRTPEGEELPSVTTILSATEDKSFLIEWKKRVGEEKAAKISREASGVGTSMHKNIENFITGVQRKPGNNLVHIQSNKMADVIIENAFPHINEIWAIEQSLYYSGLYSGTTDLVAVYKGNPSICDYKQSNKLKKEEWVEGYKTQLVAYIMAHNNTYKTDIREGHVFMCTRDLQYQQFDVWPQDFNKYQDKWLDKVEKYYKHYV